MAVTIACEDSDLLSLPEYVDFCDSRPDLRDPDAAIATAGRLKALSNNKRFLAEFLNAELEDIAAFQAGNTFKPPTFLLHRGAHYTIRAVVWLPLDDALLSPAMFSYFEAHDHNFDFLTCGYHGPGYRTVIYHYDHDRVAGYPGEPVDLEFREDTTLPEGKLMYYLASRDVHIQYPPEALSISLNLILPRPGRPRPQYEFDVERGRVLAQMNDMPLRRAIFAVAARVGDEDSAEVLLTIARGHHCPRTRAMAWEALMALDTRQADRYRDMAMADASALVRAIARGAGARRRETTEGVVGASS